MNIFQLIGLLPLLINAAEVAHGIKKGQIKKDAVMKVVVGFMDLWAKQLNTPENRLLLSNVVDQMVDALNGMGVFPTKSYAGT